MPRTPTGIDEFDRVLGGGLVSGAVVLIGGDPGIGKSTLLLQALAHLSKQQNMLYVSGEESAQQIALRAKRLALDARSLHLLPEIQLEKIQAAMSPQRKAGRGGDRFDPDRVFRTAHLRARLGGAGARMRRATDAHRQEPATSR